MDTVIQPFQGKNGIQNSLGLITPNSYVSPGRVKDKIDGEVADSSRTAAQSQLSGGDIQLQSGSDTTLQAPVIDGNSLTVTAGEINGDVIDPNAKLILQGVKENRSRSVSGSDHSFMWQSMAGQGGSEETPKMPEILLKAPVAENPTVNPENTPKPKPELNATGGLIVDAVALPGTAQEAKKAAASGDPAQPPATTTLDLKAQAHELAQQPGMAWLDDLTKRTDVDWKTVQLVHDNWDYKHSGLTPEGGIVVAIVVAILTWGAGSSLAATTTTAANGTVTATTVGGMAVSTTTAAGVTTYTTLGAALNAGLTTLATQAATSLINNQGDVGKTLNDMGSNENLQQLLVSTLTAGALQAVGGTNWANSVSQTTGLSQKLVTNLTSAAVSSTLTTAIEGGDYAKNLESALLTAGVNTAAGWAASGIGDWYAESDLAGKYIAHKVAHAVLGCAGAAAKGGDCASGAIGGAVGEAFAEMYGGASNEPLSAQKQYELLQLSKLVAMATAKAAGKDPTAAMDAAQLAVVNNYLSHAQASALENAKERRQQCTTKVCADEVDQEIKAWQLLDKKNNQALAAACIDMSSVACKTAVADVNAAAASYVGKKDGWDSFGVVGQERSEATTLANQYNSKQWCSSNSVGCSIAIASPLFPALAVTVPALLSEAIGACTLNPVGCTETINALADGVLADGAVGFVGISAAKTAVEKATVTALEKTRASVGGSNGIGKVVGNFSAIEPGPLADNLAGTFAGGRYTTVTLQNDTVLYRAGTADQPLGQFFSLEPPIGVLQTRIDKAVLPEWPGGGTSPIDTSFAVKIPAGTQVHIGEVGTQNGFYVGGTQQVVVPKPWTIPGVQVVNSNPIK